jgi:hypothetical protein
LALSSLARVSAPASLAFQRLVLSLEARDVIAKAVHERMV